MKTMVLVLALLLGMSVAAQTSNGWEEWQKTACYGKLSFRIKQEEKKGSQYHFKVQFKSEYPEIISFNYHITDKLNEFETTTHRKTLAAYKESEAIDIYTRIEDIFILADKLSLSPYPENFEDCD